MPVSYNNKDIKQIPIKNTNTTSNVGMSHLNFRGAAF